MDDREVYWRSQLSDAEFLQWKNWRAKRVLINSASNGLLNGDLKPLARMIRAGLPIDADIADQLAAAIDGPDDEGYTLKMVNRRGHRRFNERCDVEGRNVDIALYVCGQLAEAGAGAFEGVIEDAMARWHVGRSTVTKAYSDWFVDRDESDENGVALD